MSKSHRLLAAMLIGAVLSASLTVRAGSRVAGALEPTQILNNLELVKVAADGALTAAKTVDQYRLQIEQYQTQLTNLVKLPTLPPGLGTDVIKAYSDLTNYKNALTRLQGSLSQQSGAIEQRMAEARLSGRNWQSYVESVAADVANQKGRAIERMRYEESVLSQVQADYDFARNLQAQIPNTVGQQQSLQLLNAQMNRIVTQNAKMLEVISAQIGQSAEMDARKAVERTQRLSDLEIMRQRQKAIEDRQRAFGGFQ
jgi:conjugal transfer/entry exclusion protein